MNKSIHFHFIAQLGSLLPLATQPMTSTSVSPSPSYGPEASNLLNSNLLKSPESYTVRYKIEIVKFSMFNSDFLNLVHDAP
jgi:hypothetical protein